jgi:hypothetical protein
LIPPPGVYRNETAKPAIRSQSLELRIFAVGRLVSGLGGASRRQPDRDRQRSSPSVEEMHPVGHIFASTSFSDAEKADNLGRYTASYSISRRSAAVTSNF